MSVLEYFPPAASLPRFIVKGAYGDDADDLGRIQVAIDSANALTNGAAVILPNTGHSWRLSGPIILKDNVQLIGYGKPTIKLLNGTNCSVVEGLNFQSLTGTASGTGGINNWSVSNLILDGNSSNNTSPGSNAGHGLAVVGRDFLVDNVSIQNCYRTGLWTEYASSGAKGTGPYNGHIRTVLIKNTGEMGWYNDVSDLHFSDMNVFAAALNTDNTYSAVKLDTRGNVRGSGLNIWSNGVSAASLPKYALEVIADTTDLTGVVLENGRTANLRVTGNDVKILSCLMENNGTGATAFAQIIGSSGTFILRANPALGSHSVVGVQLGESGTTAAGNYLILNLVDTENGLVDWTYSAGNNFAEIVGHLDAGTTFINTPDNSDIVRHTPKGSVKSSPGYFHLGVGVTSPVHKLDVVGAKAGGAIFGEIQNIQGAAGANAGLILGTSVTAGNENVGAQVVAERTDASVAGDTDIVLYSSNGSTQTERFRAKPDGTTTVQATPAAGDSSLKIATTAFVQGELASQNAYERIRRITMTP